MPFEGVLQIGMTQKCTSYMYVFKTQPVFLFQADACPPGYFCPEGTGYRFSQPCPVGFYRKLSAAVSVQDCSVCFSGHYCDVLGLADPKVCPEVSGNCILKACFLHASMNHSAPDFQSNVTSRVSLTSVLMVPSPL